VRYTGASMMWRITLLTAAATLFAAAAQVPRPAPDLTVNLNGGKKLQLSAYKGKPVVVAFILTTCSHCQATTGLLSKLQAEFGPRGLQVVESAIEQGAEAFVPRFIQNFNPPFPVGFNDVSVAQDFAQHSPVKMMLMPLILFIDRQGNIVAQYGGGDPEMAEGIQEKTIRAEIEKLVKPAPVSPPAGARKKKQ
jgi:cytochrome oxidase Cu insertion factor (SCO1/SenC/PrrC family)